jgi:hypothetical protein
MGRVNRPGGLVLGLGIGAAMAAIPWVASADVTVPPLDPSIAADFAWPAADTPTATDLAISIDGITLVQDGTASATSGTGDIAIAFGADSTAYAVGGTNDVALADGTNSCAGAGGVDCLGDSGTGSNDTAIDIGNNTGLLNGAAATLGNHDTAVDIGNNTGSVQGALAFTGNNDTAFDIGNNSGSANGAGAFDGNNDTALDIGNNTNVDNGVGAVFGNGPQASAGNFDTAIDVGNNTGAGTVAPFGLGPIAGDTGNYNLSAVFGDSSTAIAGTGFDHDIAIAFGQDLTALANFADWIVTIVPSLFS